MTQLRVNLVLCDTPGCRVEIALRELAPGRARDIIARRGWSSPERGYGADWCPECTALRTEEAQKKKKEAG